MSLIARVRSIAPAIKKFRRRRHLTKVAHRSILKQRDLAARKVARKTKIDTLKKQKPWSPRKKLFVGTGVGGAGVGYLGYRANRSVNEEY